MTIPTKAIEAANAAYLAAPNGSLRTAMQAALTAALPHLSGWLPIETAPVNRRVMFWWTPKDPNPLAEACVIGLISGHEEGMWWDGQAGKYQSISHLKWWQPLPPPPAEPDGERG